MSFDEIQVVIDVRELFSGNLVCHEVGKDLFCPHVVKPFHGYEIQLTIRGGLNLVLIIESCKLKLDLHLLELTNAAEVYFQIVITMARGGLPERSVIIIIGGIVGTEVVTIITRSGGLCPESYVLPDWHVTNRTGKYAVVRRDDLGNLSVIRKMQFVNADLPIEAMSSLRNVMAMIDDVEVFTVLQDAMMPRTVNRLVVIRLENAALILIGCR